MQEHAIASLNGRKRLVRANRPFAQLVDPVHGIPPPSSAVRCDGLATVSWLIAGRLSLCRLVASGRLRVGRHSGRYVHRYVGEDGAVFSVRQRIAALLF